MKLLNKANQWAIWLNHRLGCTVIEQSSQLVKINLRFATLETELVTDIS